MTANERAEIRRCFAIGYRVGEVYGLQTPRMADKALRDVGIDPNNANVQAFLCGADDGNNGDRYRLELAEQLANEYMARVSP